MQEVVFSWWELLGGLALFLFGIHIFSDSIKQVGSIALKRFLRKTTNTPIKGILSGSLVTGTLQSSTVVTVMILGFVGANMIDLSSAIGAMIGASIGTTVTSWIVAVLGFKLDISAIALPIITIAGFSIFIFTKKRKFKYSALFLFGFGLLLFGLDMMSDSIAILREVFDISSYLNLPRIGFLVLGMVLTIVLQSSSATNAITISSVSAGLIPLPIGMMMMLGSHIGTSFTSIVIGLVGTRSQKQVGSVHVTFNIFAAIVGIALIQPFFWLFHDVRGFAANDVIGLPIFHTGFNIIGALIFYPFIPAFYRFLERVFKQKRSLYLSVMDVDASDIDTGLVACRQDIVSLAKDVLQYNVSLFHIDYHKLVQKDLDYSFEQYSLDIDQLNVMYNRIKSIESHLIQYCMHLQYDDSDKVFSTRVTEFNYAIMQLVQSAKMLKDISHNIEELVWSEKGRVQKEAAGFAARIRNMYVDVLDIFATEDHSQQYMQLYDLFLQLKIDDRKYLTTIHELVDANAVSTDELTHLLRVNRYVYNSSKSYLLAMRELLLVKKEREMLEQQVDKEVSGSIPVLTDEDMLVEDTIQSS